MSTFTTHVAEDQRLRVLQILERAAGYDLNIHVLRMELEHLGHRPSLDALRAELAWLEEQGLVGTRPVQDLVVAVATERGLDVAAGRAGVPGVARPRPE